MTKMVKTSKPRLVVVKRSKINRSKVSVNRCESKSVRIYRGNLTPAEGNGSRPVGALLHQRFVELATGPGVDAGPAVLAVVLQASDVGAKVGRKLATAPCALALVAVLVI